MRDRLPRTFIGLGHDGGKLLTGELVRNGPTVSVCMGKCPQVDIALVVSTGNAQHRVDAILWGGVVLDVQAFRWRRLELVWWIRIVLPRVAT